MKILHKIQAVSLFIALALLWLPIISNTIANLQGFNVVVIVSVILIINIIIEWMAKK